MDKHPVRAAVMVIGLLWLLAFSVTYAQDNVRATMLHNTNVRAEPNADAVALGVLSAGTTVEIQARFLNEADELWLLIPFDDEEGWIAGWLVTITGDIETIPVWRVETIYTTQPTEDTQPTELAEDRVV